MKYGLPLLATTFCILQAQQPLPSIPLTPIPSILQTHVPASAALKICQDDIKDKDIEDMEATMQAERESKLERTNRMQLLQNAIKEFVPNLPVVLYEKSLQEALDQSYGALDGYKLITALDPDIRRTIILKSCIPYYGGEKNQLIQKTIQSKQQKKEVVDQDEIERGAKSVIRNRLRTFLIESCGYDKRHVDHYYIREIAHEFRVLSGSTDETVKTFLQAPVIIKLEMLVKETKPIVIPAPAPENCCVIL